MYSKRNFLARSPYVYTSSAIVTTEYHFTPKAGNTKNYLGLPVKYPIYLPDFNQTWIFSTDLRKSFR
jgi:hypothetical protein